MFRAVFFGMATFTLTTFTLTTAGLAADVASGPAQTAEMQVTETERAFAASMAARDVQAFADFVADDAVFFTTDPPLRGKAQIVAYWRRWFVGKPAPFSWKPERVTALASGTLALSSGPVFDPAGKRVGSFTSIWRLEAPGRWCIVFDRGGN